MITIRQTTDLEEIERLDRTLFAADTPVNYAKSYWWIARDGNKSVAYAGLRVMDKNMAFLSRAGVVENARGKGLHRRLIQVRVRWAWLHGLNTLITYTLINNQASSNNLIRTGFRLYDPEWAWVGRWVLYWIRTKK
jgi:GNAT superfamily N-acetyltransferase